MTEKKNGNDSYEDIINLPRPVSGKHPPMPLEKRATQFAPFAALNGYEEAIAETARRTEKEVSSEIMHIQEE